MFDNGIKTGPEKIAALFPLLGLNPHFFCNVQTGLPGLNEYLAADKVICSPKSNSVGIEAQTSNPLIPSLMLYQLSHCTLL